MGGNSPQKKVHNYEIPINRHGYLFSQSEQYLFFKVAWSENALIQDFSKCNVEITYPEQFISRNDEKRVAI